MRRSMAALAALLTLALVAVVLVAGLPGGRARAQQTNEMVFVDNFGVDPDAGGYATLLFPIDWDVTAVCNGAYPINAAGGQVPSQVMNRKPAPNALMLRLRLPTGNVVTAPARVNCSFDIVSPAAVSVSAARAAVQRAAARQVASVSGG